MSQIITQVLNLGIQLLIAVLVWRYYREKNFSIYQKYSTFGPRFWTGSVDTCVMWPVGFLAGILLALELPSAVGVVLVVAGNLAWLFYTVIMHAKYGQTYGKMICKVRVVDFGTERPISFRQALLREGIPIAVSLGIVSYEIYAIGAGELSGAAVARGEIVKNPAFWVLATLPGLWFFAEVLTMLTNDKRRALHDIIAGTVVIRTNAIG